MKDQLIYIFWLPVLLFFSGCGDFVEGYDESPNSPTKVNASQLLSSAELGLQVSYTSGVDRASSILVQQIAGTKEQMLEIASYTLREGDHLNEWNNIYGNIIQTCNDLERVAGDGNPYYSGMAKVIKVMGLALASDVWGDVPAEEAGLGNITGNLTPKFDKQESVYQLLQDLLVDALKDFDAEERDNVFLPGSDDFFFGGDVGKWKNIVRILQARYANRLSKKNPSGSAASVLEYLKDVADLGDLNAIYGTSTNEMNQWYAFENARKDYIKMGKYFIDGLIVMNDPRLPFYASKSPSGEYIGCAANSEDTNTSSIGPYINSPSAPIPIVTYSEALFLKSEASYRKGDLVQSALIFNDAVKSSIKQVTKNEAPADYIASYASETESTITLSKIMVQKYFLMFVNVEAWNDWRRTGFPVLVPNSNASNKGIPVRFPTVIDERKYNPNAIVVSDIYKHVWWAE
ncbi:MAG: SusD/RagB family nutrient-binding outer membrane lipoprotein [Bacteroidales bacterium]|nr:SusD/RagB family nutrient-binding outer membrane lipoprotein [Bacteroidales bacterium]